MTEDKEASALQRAAKLLLEGAIMLRESCPQCISPLYQKKDGTLYCTSCDRRVVREGEIQRPEKAKSSASPIQAKIDKLAAELEDTTDPEKIVKISETIRSLEKIRDS